MHQYDRLRAQYPLFRYTAYHIAQTDTDYEITYDFEIPGLAEFHPRWVFDKNAAHAVDIENDAVFRNLVYQLGMVELVSYWKITCSPRVEVTAGALCDAQKTWWKTLYFGGLGEFFHVNGIEANAADFMTIDAVGAPLDLPAKPRNDLRGTLVPIGGGKDSAVTLEVLRSLQADNYCYIINPRGATDETASTAGYGAEHVITVQRTLDARMLELNRAGYLNGHTPFSAIVAFSAVLTAYIHRIAHVALSNESSANESTVAGSEVNHQYSKSFAFERDFHAYEEHYLRTNVHYFSLLRPLSEYQIAGLFSGYTQYHPIFRSCNAGSKQNIWCGHCPKCLFVYIILSPFLSTAQLKNIFGKNLLEDETLLENFEKLTGILPEKPFECVGEREEVNFALCETVRRMERESEALPHLLAYYRTTDAYARTAARENPFPTYYDETNLLPPQYETLLKKALKSMEQGRESLC